MLSVALWMIVDIVLNSMMWIVDAARHSFQTLWIRCRGRSAQTYLNGMLLALRHASIDIEYASYVMSCMAHDIAQ